MRRARNALAVCLVIVAAGVGVAKWPRPKAAAAARPVKTAEVTTSDVDVTLRVSGQLEAAQSVPIVNWAQQTQIVWLLPEGTWVKPGDVVIKLNVANAKKQLTEAERQHAQGEQQSQTQVDDARRRLQNATTGLQKAKDDLRLVQLQSQAATEKAAAEVEYNQREVEVAQGEQSKYQRLAGEHLVPVARLDSVNDEVRRKQFALAKAQRDQERAKQDAEASEKVKQLDVTKAEIELAQAQAGLNQAQADTVRAQAMQGLRLEEATQQVTDCEIKAGLAGMLLLENTWEMGMRRLRVGDQVEEGMKVASIIDPRKMLVQCDVGEADISLVRVGQPGLVRVPAIGNKELRGTVQSIDNLARERFIWEGGTPGKKVFNVTLLVTQGDNRLRPGMTGTVEITVNRTAHALAVPAEALFAREGKTVVYRQKGATFEAVPVQVVRRGEMEAAIAGAVKRGDVVACELPPPERLGTAKERTR